MSDDTKSDYTRTGKKVRCINSNRIDLTYKKVYDVFTTQDSVDFIIDDVGVKRYESLEFPRWCEKSDGMVDKANETKHKFSVGDKVKVVDIGFISKATSDTKVGDVGVITYVDSDYVKSPYRVEFDDDYWWFTDKCIELVDDVVDNTYETKPKFKVGDKVKVVSTYYTSQFVDVINVGDTGITGVIISIDDNDYITPYLVKFDDSNVGDNWWFTDKCIELVSDDTNTIEKENIPIKSDGSQIVSDGGSSSYYAQQIPKGMLERFNTTGTIEAKDVIRLFLGNDFNMGNIFKAYCRIISLRNGKGKAGIDEQYDLTKVKYFAEDELNYYLENKDV